MKGAGSESHDSSTETTLEQDQKEAEGRDGDAVKIIDVLVADTVGAKSVENGTAVTVCVYSVLSPNTRIYL